MKLVQSRIVTDDVQQLAVFYARLIGVPVALNEYYVEVNAGAMSVGFSKRSASTGSCRRQRSRGETGT